MGCCVCKAGKQDIRSESNGTQRWEQLIIATRDYKLEYQANLVRTTEERKAVFAVRMLVFVEEQAVPVEEELDAFDVAATHFLVRSNSGPPTGPAAIVGTARLVDKGEGTGKIGRVAVLREHRGRGAGRALMLAVEQEARRLGFTRLLLDAQVSALPFYARLGYTAEGDLFMDAGIEHRRMHRAL